MDSGWEQAEIGGVTLVRCRAVARAGLAHGFSTRVARGESRFDLGGAGPVGADVASRRGRFLAAAGLPGARPTSLHQVHGCRVLRAAEVSEDTRADGALWLAGEPAATVPAVRSADCVPILLWEREGAAAAAVHAGWRGTAAGIAARAVELLSGLGLPPSRLRAALGPSIGGCCYEVGAEVAGAVAAAGTGARPADGAPGAGRTRIDLRRENRRQLERAGLPPEGIHLCRWCTACRDDLFFSHRREGPAAGRMMAVIGPALS